MQCVDLESLKEGKKEGGFFETPLSQHVPRRVLKIALINIHTYSFE
jgi:hypothetical protein